MADHAADLVAGHLADSGDRQPAYTVRESLRARHARLLVSLRDGLVVVIPKGFGRARITALLEGKKLWIEKALARVHAQRDLLLEPEPPGCLPGHLALRGIGEEWMVCYRPTESPRVAALERKGNRLLVSGDVSNPNACKDALRRWLSRRAHKRLVPWLNELADERGFRLSRSTVRLQRTRWGSCSRQGAVSLNLKLLFVPVELVKYVLVHELCHRVHLNHSKRFWALVTKHDPDFREKETGLKDAFRYIPAWLES